MLALALALTPLAAAQREGPVKKPPGVFLTQQEALELAFPKAEIVRASVYLSKAEQAQLSKLAGHKVSQAILYPYRAYAKLEPEPGQEQGDKSKRGALLGTAYFDTHKVRSLRETLMLVVDPAGKVARIEVLAFGEPKQYLPRAKWLAQFVGRELGPELDLKRKIKGIAGASMSARAATHCVRRLLAGHQLVEAQAAREAERKRRGKTPPDKTPPPGDKGGAGAGG